MSEARRGYTIEIFDSKVPFNEALAVTRESNEGNELSSINHEDRKNEVLLIDGQVIPYLKTTKGFQIYYQEPKSSLIEVARDFIDTQREK